MSLLSQLGSGSLTRSQQVALPMLLTTPAPIVNPVFFLDDRAAIGSSSSNKVNKRKKSTTPEADEPMSVSTKKEKKPKLRVDLIRTSWDAQVREQEHAEEAVLNLLFPPAETGSPSPAKFTAVFDDYVQSIVASIPPATISPSSSSSLSSNSSSSSSSSFLLSSSSSLSSATSIATPSSSEVASASYLPLSHHFICRSARFCLEKLDAWLERNDDSRSANTNTANGNTNKKISKRTDKALEGAEALWGPLSVLIRSHALSGRSSPNLVIVLLKGKQWALVMHALHCIHDLNEGDVVLIVQAVLGEMLNASASSASTSASSLSSSSSSSSMLLLSSPSSASPSLEAVLQAALGSSACGDFLQDYLQGLSSLEAVALLSYLLSCVQQYWLQTEAQMRQGSHTTSPLSPSGVVNATTTTKNKKTEKVVHATQEPTLSASSPAAPAQGPVSAGPFQCSGATMPSLYVILDWLSHVLDAHFARLVLLAVPSSESLLSLRLSAVSPACAASAASATNVNGAYVFVLLKELESIISDMHIPLCNQIQTLKGFLAQWSKESQKNNRNSHRLPTVRDYLVEFITI